MRSRRPWTLARIQELAEDMAELEMGWNGDIIGLTTDVQFAVGRAAAELAGTMIGGLSWPDCASPAPSAMRVWEVDPDA